MALHNTLFGRSVRVIGGIPSDAGPQLVISQVFLKGTSPSRLLVDEYLRAQGFLRIKDVKGYFRREDSVALFDAHQRNFVLTENVPVPFDLITIHVTDPAFRAALDYWT